MPPISSLLDQAVTVRLSMGDQTGRSISEHASVGFYVNVQTTGVTLSSANVHRHAAPPVPEPVAWLLLALGLPLLAAWRRFEHR